jgi:uncharacterized membrane protein YtjA (UPF0391 family)
VCRFRLPRGSTRACVNASSVGLFRSGLCGTIFFSRGCLVERGEAPQSNKERTMLGWALTFLVVALIAAVLGFGGIAGLSIEIAKIIFFVAIVLFLISAVIGLLRGRSPTVN